MRKKAIKDVKNYHNGEMPPIAVQFTVNARTPDLFNVVFKLRPENSKRKMQCTAKTYSRTKQGVELYIQDFQGMITQLEKRFGANSKPWKDEDIEDAISLGRCMLGFAGESLSKGSILEWSPGKNVSDEMAAKKK